MGSYRSFAVTVTGSSHIKHGKGCEDSSDKYDGSGVSIAVVSDGHGDDNCFRSAKGAEFAVDCAKRGIQDFVKYLDEPEDVDPDEINQEDNEIRKKGVSELKRVLSISLKKSLKWMKRINQPIPVPIRESLLKNEEAEAELKERLVESIRNAWFKMTADDIANCPVTGEELINVGEKYRKRYQEGKDLHHAYGATLITAAITSYYWFGIHIGDGRFTALYADGTFDQPVPWDEKCYLNVTTSICDDDVLEHARCYFSFHEVKAPPVAVFLCSDGIDDNYPVDENEKYLFKLYRTIALTFAEDGFESTSKQLEDLANQFATKGKGDDTSIAGFIDMETLMQAVPVWKNQIAEEEAAAEKAAVEKSAAERAQPVTEAESEKPTAAVSRIAAAEYQKNMGSAKNDILSYGGFVLPKRDTEKK